MADENIVIEIAEINNATEGANYAQYAEIDTSKPIVEQIEAIGNKAMQDLERHKGKHFRAKITSPNADSMTLSLISGPSQIKYRRRLKRMIAQAQNHVASLCGVKL